MLRQFSNEDASNKIKSIFKASNSLLCEKINCNLDFEGINKNTQL